jgi:UPF0042 nucleotide-binding protein
MKKIIIVSGVSGSGKSIALQALEDLGFYCIDNLPIGLLASFVQEMNRSPGGDAVEAAVGVDVRNLGTDIAKFLAGLDVIKEGGVNCEMLFLDADTETLLKRFNETRRRHPLTKANIPLMEAIKLERALLQPVLERADWRIDTSWTTIHQLRELIRVRLKQHAARSLSLLFLSFGYKHGLPRDADFVFDVRCLPNPHWDPALRSKTGKDPEVVIFLQAHATVEKMLADIGAFLHSWLPRFEADNRSYMTVAIGCTGGQHRSVYFVEKLAAEFNRTRSNVLVRHRELP